MNLTSLHSLSAADLRAVLPAFVAAHVEAPADAAAAAAVRASIERVPDEELYELVRRLVVLGEENTTYPAYPLARRLGRATMAVVMAGSRVVGAEHLAPGDGRGEVWLCNHLSYIDTQVTDRLLCDAGRSDRADGLIAVAGPKVYAEPFRRMAALSLNTLKTVQSGRISHNEVAMSPRDLARIAMESVALAKAWRENRGALLIYPEGTRSRTGHMGPWLRGVERYLRGAKRVVPIAVVGTDRLFSFRERMVPGEVELRIGQPFPLDAVSGGKDDVLRYARDRVAELLPPELQPDGDALT